MATKEHRRHAKGLVEELESRVHTGPPVHDAEIVSARQFLLQSEFSPASDYFSRLARIQNRIEARSIEPVALPGKRNYGGQAAGYWMQLQSAYDHVILSTCYEGEFNLKRGRVKLSHRFNQEGRTDFVEMKLLQSLDTTLNGALRKLLTLQEFQKIKRDWWTAEAFVLEVLPRELVFLYDEAFRCPRNELFAWLINIGHRLARDLVGDLRTRPINGFQQSGRNGTQLCLPAVRSDRVAMPVLEKAAQLESRVETAGRVVVSYYSV